MDVPKRPDTRRSCPTASGVKGRTFRSRQRSRPARCRTTVDFPAPSMPTTSMHGGADGTARADSGSADIEDENTDRHHSTRALYGQADCLLALSPFCGTNVPVWLRRTVLAAAVPVNPEALVPSRLLTAAAAVNLARSVLATARSQPPRSARQDRRRSGRWRGRPARPAGEEELLETPQPADAAQPVHVCRPMSSSRTVMFRACRKIAAPTYGAGARLPWRRA